MSEPGICKTGINGLDEMIGKGIPEGWSILVCGTPGSGKTTLCAQFLSNGAKLYNETGLLVLLEENFFYYIHEMDQIGLDLSTLIGTNKIIVVDASPVHGNLPNLEDSPVIRLENSVGEDKFNLSDLVTQIEELKKRYNPKRLVIDSISAFQLDMKERNLRKELLCFFDRISYLGLTSLLVSHFSLENIGKGFPFEEFIAQGIILVHRFRVGSERVRGIEIYKLRGVNHDATIRPFIIGTDGIRVYSKEKVFTTENS